jgi:hypothetical protein
MAHRLKNAFDQSVEGCAILRTRIINIPGRGLFQVVLKDGQLVRKHGSDLARYLKTDQAEPMDLGSALFRYGVVHDGNSDKAQFIITMHHAVYDGWSMPLVFDRVNRAFVGLETSRPVSFKHFIKYLTSQDPTVSKDYWKERFG